MTKKVNTHINFNENCEYQYSSTDITINVEPQPVNIQLDVSNLNTLHPQNINYYDDIIEITAYVSQIVQDNERTIKTGRINFYYRTNTSNKTILLNDDENSCVLTDLGQASLQFRPNQSGVVIAEYIDDRGWYQTVQTSTVIELNPIPVTINFTKKPPYLSDLEDSVELEVEVKRQYGEELINYGVVTFLHYIEHYDMNDPNKRVEHVIGNPVLVEKGKAKIKYIPVQEYSDLEPTTLIDGTEYIRAVYSYNNDLYFSEENEVNGYESITPSRNIKSWDYFTSASIYTNIAIFKPNSVRIGIQNQSTNSSGEYCFTEKSQITVTATLFDDDGNAIELPQDAQTSLALHINGKYLSLNKNYLIDSEDNVEECFVYNDVNITIDNSRRENERFIFTISNLKPGYYTIQASTQGQIINGSTLIYPDTKTITTEDINGETHLKYDTNEIRNDIYLDSVNSSNMLYINSMFEKINYSIETVCNKQTIITQEVANNYINSIIDIPNKYSSFLNGQRCTFFIPKIQATYIGTISIENGKLVGRPIDEIRLDSGDYRLYMYIPGGYYKDNDNVIYIDTDRKESTNTFIDNNTPIVYTYYQPNTPTTIRVRSDITLNLECQITSNTALGSIDYTISSDDIYKDEDAYVDITLTKDNNIISTHTYILTSYINSWNNSVNDLEAGTYTLTASTGGFTTSQDFTILPGALSQQLQSNSAIINATPNGIVGLVIKSSTADLTNLDIDKLHVYVCKDTDTFDFNTAIEHNILSHTISENKIDLIIDAGTYVPTKLLIATYYDEDNNIKGMLCDADECNTVLVQPYIKPLNFTLTTAFFAINPASRGIIVAGKVAYYDDNNLLETRCFITSDTLEIYLQDVPIECNNIQFTIDPHDEQIKQYIISQNFPLNTERPSIFFYNTTISDMTSATTYLRKQYEDSNRQCLFPLFKQYEVKFSRNIR